MALAHCLYELGRDGSFLSGQFDGVILECDTDLTPEGYAPPSPGLFLRLRRDRNPSHVNAGIVDAALSFATAAVPDPHRLRMLEAVLQALPTGARLSWCAVMAGRRLAPLRLVVACRRAEVHGFLQTIRHPVRPEAVDDVLAATMDFPDRICLSIDLTAAGLMPRLGVEMHFGGPADRGLWNRLMLAMADRGWLLAHRGAALASCAGFERYFDRDKMATLLWGVNHVKAVVAEHGTTVKGYVVCLLRR